MEEKYRQQREEGHLPSRNERGEGKEGGKEGGREGGREKRYLRRDAVDTADTHHEGYFGLGRDIEGPRSLRFAPETDLVVFKLGEGGREEGREEGRKREEGEDGVVIRCPTQVAC